MIQKYGIAFLKLSFKLIALLFSVSIVTFFLASLSPVDPIFSYTQGDTTLSAEQLEQIAVYWGLDEPPISRYFTWASNLLSGDFGTSLLYRKSVVTVIVEKFIVSFPLLLTAWILSGVIGFFMGVLAGVYKGRFVDSLIKIWCLVLQSSPEFWIALILILVFSVQLNWFPSGFAVPIGVLSENVTPLQKIHHMILPAIAISLTSVSSIALHTREKMIQALESEYATFSFARGDTVWQFVRRHGLRNIISPAITLHFFSISSIFGGSILAETVFHYPGLGEATVTAGLTFDMPLLLAIVLLSAVFVFLGNQTANFLYAIIDPRIGGGDFDV
ncbi:MAG: ABC transporter permease [Bacillota bacterium]